MALLKLGPIVEGISGSLGSVTFANTRSGFILKQRKTPNAASTPQLLRQQAAFKTVHSLWRALTDAQRLSWNIAAQNLPQKNTLHLPKLITGWQLFLKIHSYSPSFYPPSSTDPPGLVVTRPHSSLVLEAWESTQLVKLSFDAYGVNTAGKLIYGFRPMTTAPIRYFNRWRFLFWSVSYISTTFDMLGPHMVTNWGPLREGETIGARLITWDTDILPSKAATCFCQCAA